MKVKVKLVPIGNSKDIRILRSFVEAGAFGNEVELGAGGGVLAPAGEPRQGWDDREWRW